VTENILALTGDQLSALQGKGQTFAGYDYDKGGIRLTRDGSGYSPLPGASNHIVLTSADLDVIQSRPEGLIATDTLGEKSWRVTASSRGSEVVK
jgi:hypothetical protein